MPTRHPKPSLFIGSSTEGKSYARALQENLEEDAECTVWDQDVFKLTKDTLGSLLDTLSQSDFGAFLFTPDDLVTLRGEAFQAARDNVVFE